MNGVTKTKRKKTKKSSRGKRWRTAKGSDPHELYELSVQEPEAECELIDQVWKEQRGRTPHHIREDFCGTAVVAMEWVKWRRTNTAVGVDIDPEVLNWGKQRMPDRLTPSQQDRIKFVRGDVRTDRAGGFDSVLAMNFSYWLLKTRSEMKRYFQSVRKALVKDGLFLLDAYGGSEALVEMTEDRNVDGFTYVWDQHHYNPITGDILNYIHFEFPDGTKMNKAFTYDWRLWMLPEIRDVLFDAGFKDVVVYWEGTNNRTGEGNGVWKVSTKGEAIEGWLAYLVAKK